MEHRTVDTYTVDHHTAEFRSHNYRGVPWFKGDFHTVDHGTADTYTVDHHTADIHTVEHHTVEFRNHNYHREEFVIIRRRFHTVEHRSGVP